MLGLVNAKKFCISLCDLVSSYLKKKPVAQSSRPNFGRRSGGSRLTRREFLKRSALAGIGGMLTIKGVLAYDKQRESKKNISLEKAWELHKKCLIIDGHNDVTLTRIVGPNKEIPLKWMEQDVSPDASIHYQTDIPRMRWNGQQYVALMIMSAGRGIFPNCIRNINVVDQSIRENPTAIMKVLTSADAIAAGAANKVGVIYAIEGSYGPLGGDIATVQKLYDRGIRAAGITHGEGGTDKPGYLQGTPSSARNMTPPERADYMKNSIGLTPFGHEALKEMNRLGVIVDLSHSNDRTVFDVVEKSSSPPIVSHTVASTICRTARGLTDEQIKAVAARGGVMGITFVPGFIAEKPADVNIDKFIDHICHTAEIGGGDCVGIGSDYDGVIGYPLLVNDVSQLVLVTQGLMNRGFTEEEIKKIWGGNFLRIMKKIIDRP